MKDLWSAIKPLYFYIKITCLCPYKLVGRYGERNLSCSRITILAILVQVTFVSYFAYCLYTLIIPHSSTIEIKVSSVNKVVLGLQMFATTFSIISNFLMFHVYRKNIVEVFSKVHEIDQLLCSLNLKVDYNLFFKYGIKVLILLTLVNLLTIVYLIFEQDLIINRFMVFAYPNLIVVGSHCFLGILIYDTEYRFTLLKQELLDLHESYLLVGKGQNSENKFVEILDRLQNVINIYMNLNWHCKNINSIFNAVLAAVFSGSFICVVGSLYYMTVEPELNSQYIFHLLFWNSYNVVIIIYLVRLFNGATDQVILF